MITWKCMPDDWQDFGLAGEWPIEIYATIDFKRGCPDARPHVSIERVIALFGLYGTVELDITKVIVTSPAALRDWEEQVLKHYMQARGFAEESA